MGKLFDAIQPAHREFMAQQHLFFVATAPLEASGHVNLSPKGLDSFRVLTDWQVAYRDLAGSGNETSAHLRQNGRITFMFCAFGGPPLILRLYGQGRAVLPGADEWAGLAALFPPHLATRQFIVADIDLVQTSCGFGVPLYTYTGERDLHTPWAAKKGEAGLQAYIDEKNTTSLDGLPTHWQG
jgi:hypothetical protein